MKCEDVCKHGRGVNCGDGIYGVGVIGAAFYFLQGVSGFVPVVVGIFKAFFWPAFVVFKILGMLSV